MTIAPATAGYSALGHAAGRSYRFAILALLAVVLLGTAALSAFALRSSRSAAVSEPIQLVAGPGPNRCDFDYPGPLRLQDLGCLDEVLPFKSAVYLSKVGKDAVHDIRGIRVPGVPPVPIFIQFKDRITYLLEFIRSLHRVIQTPFEIIIIDDSSTFPAAVNFLKRLNDSGITILHPAARAADAPFDMIYKDVAKLITAHMNTTEAENFIWTDPDVPLDGDGPGDILVVYAEALRQHGELYNVGCSLRWDNWLEEIRDGKIENEKHWVKAPVHCLEYRQVCYHYLEAPIDTTFAMFRKGVTLKRLSSPSIRMIAPLGCRHLDWIIPKDSIPADVRYYASKTTNEVNHSWFRNPPKKNGRREIGDGAPLAPSAP
ncbi:hypothetical protein HDU88_002366 [Geranomyces variabilis]|nr:hypothetical protein HDU88_002366 [Geranomyces variabilis]